jgi:two-component sensor histidine kinase
LQRKKHPYPYPYLKRHLVKPFSSPGASWLSLCFVAVLMSSCQPQSSADEQLFSQKTYPVEGLSSLADTAAMMSSLKTTLRPIEQADSLLILADRLKGYDADISLFYAKQAYEVAEDKGWDLQKAISLYYIAFMKRRLQTWGGGIEDALADAEISRLLFERLGRQDWLIRVYDLIGIIYYRQYERDRPLKRDTARYYFQKAFELLEIVELDRVDSLNLAAEILHDIGTTYVFENDSIAKSYFKKSYDNFVEIDDQPGLSRHWLSAGDLLIKEKKYAEADSLLKKSRAFAESQLDNELLIEVYLRQSHLFLRQYKKNRTPQQFEKIIAVLQKRLALQKRDKYRSYQQLGIAYKSYAVTQYLKSENFNHTDSVNHYIDLTYAYVDTALSYYKIAIEDAREQGVLSVMDNLTKNIYNNCINKIQDGQGNCDEILDAQLPSFIALSYKKVADLMTYNLVNANNRIREMERMENERVAGRKRRNIVWIGIGVLLVASLVFLLFLQRAEQKKLRARMDALRAQINPHFLSNSLNAIENLVNKGDNKAASKYLVHFSRLSRMILSGSRKGEVTLSEELSTLKHFLKIEQLRFPDKLQFSFEQSPDLDANNILVPAMILQPYVENAILHGIKPKASQGHLLVKTEKEGKLLKCIIEDDGIGREKSRQLKAKSALGRQSHGMKITEERLKATGKAKGAKVEIIDRYDANEQPLGTRVVIKMPIKKKKLPITAQNSPLT